MRAAPDVPAAVPAASSVVARDAPDATPALHARARELQEAGEWGPEALAVNDAILAAEPGCEPAVVRRARCLRAMGRLEEAHDALAALLEANPDNLVAESQLRAVARRLDARRQAEDILRQGRPELFAELESAKAGERDPTFQVEGRRLLARRARTPEAACALAAAQRRDRDLDGAINTYRWVLARNPPPGARAMAQVGLAAVFRDLRRPHEAEQLARRALDADPYNRHAALTLIAVLLDLVERYDDRDALADAEAIMTRLQGLDIRDPPMAAAALRLRKLGDRPWR